MVIINGKEYSSRRDVLQNLGLSTSSVYRYKSRNNCSFEQAVEALLARNKGTVVRNIKSDKSIESDSSTKPDKKFLFHNVEYSSYKEAFQYLLGKADVIYGSSDEARVQFLETYLRKEFYFEDSANLFLLGKQYSYISEACKALSLDFRYVASLVKRHGDKEHIKCSSQLVFLDYFNRLVIADFNMIFNLKMPVTVEGKEYISGLEALQTFGYDVYNIALIMKECNMDFSVVLEELRKENIQGTEEGCINSWDRLDFMIRQTKKKTSKRYCLWIFKNLSYFPNHLVK